MVRGAVARVAALVGLLAVSAAVHGQPEDGRAMARALSLLEAGEVSAAEAVLRDIVAASPGHGPAHMQLGRIALERGDAEAAREHLSVAVVRPLPRPYLAWQLLAEAEELAGRPLEATTAWEEAARHAARALEEQPDQVAALRVAVAAAEARDDAWTALAAYDALMLRYPAAPGLLAGAARAARALGALDAARALAARAVAAAPGDATLQQLDCGARLAAGDPSGAVESCRRARALGAAGAELEITLGHALFETLAVEEAVAAFRRALAADSRAVEAMPAVVLAALAGTATDEVRPLLDEVLAVDPDQPVALRGLGLVALREGDLERARAHFERLAQLQPDDPQAWYNLGRILVRLGEDGPGRDALQRFERLEAAAAAEWERRNAAFRQRIEAQEIAAGDPAAALRRYQEIAADGLATAEDFLAAGDLLVTMGEGEAAARWLAEIPEGFPRQSTVLEHLARAAEASGRAGDAARYRDRIRLLERLETTGPSGVEPRVD